MQAPCGPPRVTVARSPGRVAGIMMAAEMYQADSESAWYMYQADSEDYYD